jgi:EpsI family protein
MNGALAGIRARLAASDTGAQAIAVALGVTLILFWPTVSSFAGTWSRYDYTHGWLVPPLLAWVLWSARSEFRRPSGGDPLLLPPLLGLSVIWALAHVMHIQLLHQTAFIALMVFWGLYVFGRNAAQTVLVMGGVLLLSIPVLWPLTGLLRRLTTMMSGAMVTILGVPATIEGDLIHLRAGSFEIVDGCAGLNYLLSALLIGLVFAQILVHGKWRRLLVVALAAVISVVGNWVRVAALVVIGHLSDMQAWLIPNHIEFGWGIFVLGLLLFFFLATRIERRSPARPGGAGEPVPVNESRNPGESEEATVTVASRRPNQARRLAVATGVAILGPLLFLGMSVLPSRETGPSPLLNVAGDSTWKVDQTGSDRPFDWHPDFHGAHQHETVRFTNGNAYVYADRFLYLDQRQGAKLVGHPNAIAGWGRVIHERIVGPVDPAGRRWVRQAVVRTDQGPVLTWYWYRVGGKETFVGLQAKALEIPAFLTRRRASEMIALSAVCEQDDCRLAFEKLVTFSGARRADDRATHTPTDATTALEGPSADAPD